MKKLLSVILTLAMTVSCFTVAFAENESGLSNGYESVTETMADGEPSDESEPAVGGNTDENAGDGEVTDNNEIVATISLCSCVYVWPISGHTWIYVHNNSDEPLQVGYYEVPAGEGVSIGAFSFSVLDGWGIYYNIEAYKENTKGRMNRVRSISEDMTASDLETLNRSLKTYPNYWGIVGNCATFAFSMWNAVTGDAYFSLLIPAISDFMIMLGGGKRGALEMYCPSRERVFRQRGSGSNGYLDEVSDYTVS